MQINDVQFQVLRQTYTGSLTDMLSAFKQDNSITSWHDWYETQGFTEPQVNDRAMAYWSAQVPL